MAHGRNAEVAWLGLGSNLGDLVLNLTHAALELSVLPGSSLLAVSGIYRTRPLGEGFTGDFYNAVVGLLTGLDPEELLTHCLDIEERLGRDRSKADRTIDIDILLFGNRVIQSGHLTVPHPRMLERRFVLEPLSEVAPNVIHPLEQRQVRYLLEDRVWPEKITKLRQPLLPAWGC